MMRAKQAWNYRKAPTDHDKELRKVAEDKIRERNETDREMLLHLQGREIKSLESEKTFIDKERSRDVADDEHEGNRGDQSALRPAGSRSGAAAQYVSRPKCRGLLADTSASRPVSTS